MARGFVTAATVLSLFLCVASALMWGCSAGTPRDVAWLMRDFDYRVESSSGGWTVYVAEDPQLPTGPGVLEPVLNVDSTLPTVRIPGLELRHFSFLEFRYEDGRRDGGVLWLGGQMVVCKDLYWQVEGPWWFVTLFSLALPLTRLRNWYLIRARLMSGFCVACGYDLRANSGRCPECGTLTPALPALAS
jgi:hypothetical protein